jgi:hypothetical protein
MFHAFVRSSRVIALILVLAPGTSHGSQAELARLPVSLQISVEPKEIIAGQRARIAVSLKDIRGAETLAVDPVAVDLSTPLLSNGVRLTIPAGRSSSFVELDFPTAALARIKATAPLLSPGAALLIVRPQSSERSATGLAPAHPSDVPSGGGTLAPLPEAGRHEKKKAETIGAKPLAPLPHPQPVATASPSIRLDVLARHIHPQDGAWKTNGIRVIAVDAAGVPEALASDLRVRLSADLGHLSPDRVVIRAGASTHDEDIQLTSSAPGRDVVRAWTPTGQPVEQEVEYESPVPTQLGVRALPERVANTGKSPVNVTVLLYDAQNHPTPLVDRELSIRLVSTLGELRPRSELTIKRGSFAEEATLASATAGEATISAIAPGMAEAKGTVVFLFPWRMVILAALGGFLGALVRDLRTLAASRWLANLARHLLSGAILGGVFYGLTFFGATASIPKMEIPVNLAAIPTANEFGALLLGFMGGYFGRRFFERTPKATTTR